MAEEGRPRPLRPVDRTVLGVGAPPPGGGPRPPGGPISTSDDTLPFSGVPLAADDSVFPSPSGGARTTVLPRLQPEPGGIRLVRDERRRFEVVRGLGEGGAGEVLLARDNDIGRTVAVKRIRGEIRSPEALARFVEEIRTVGMLEHPNVIPIHDVGVDERGEYYFVMKFVDGETLASIISRLAAGDRACHGLYPFEQRVQLFRGLLEAVAFAHSQGVVHRDIKPENVMVGRFGEVLLMDWGIARRVGGEGSAPADAEAGMIIGTPAYMSPEQARGAPADERSDVYSLCVLLYELLFLRHPLSSLESVEDVLRAVVSEPISLIRAPASPHQPLVPMDLRWYLVAGLEKDPSRRYPSVAAMIERLDRRAEGLIPIQCHITFVKRASSAFTRFAERHPMLFTALALAAIGGAVTGLVLGLS